MSVADLQLLRIPDVESMSSASILEMCISALQSAFSSNSMRIGELESHLVPNNSGFDMGASMLESIECLLRFTKDPVSIMQQQLQS